MQFCWFCHEVAQFSLCSDSEQEILREEINSLQAVKNKLQGRIKDLEEELKKTREDLEKKNQAAQEQETEVTTTVTFKPPEEIVLIFFSRQHCPLNFCMLRYLT